MEQMIVSLNNTGTNANGTTPLAQASNCSDAGGFPYAPVATVPNYWQSEDAPAQLYPNSYTSGSYNYSFQDYFMYQPVNDSLGTSIWVTLGTSTWGFRRRPPTRTVRGPCQTLLRAEHNRHRLTNSQRGRARWNHNRGPNNVISRVYNKLRSIAPRNGALQRGYRSLKRPVQSNADRAASARLCPRVNYGPIRRSNWPASVGHTRNTKR